MTEVLNTIVEDMKQLINDWEKALEVLKLLMESK